MLKRNHVNICEICLGAIHNNKIVPFLDHQPDIRLVVSLSLVKFLGVFDTWYMLSITVHWSITTITTDNDHGGKIN